MADWTETWRPQAITPYVSRMGHKTLITPFESGKEQRRSKWAKEKNRFVCHFNALSKSTFYAIKEFAKARSGAYDSFRFPNYDQFVKGTRLTIDVTADTIADSSSEFSSLGFDSDYDICVAHSSESNDGYYFLTTVANNLLTITGNVNGNDESLNNFLVVYKVYTVRFLQDTFQSNLISTDKYSLSFELIEVF